LDSAGEANTGLQCRDTDALYTTDRQLRSAAVHQLDICTAAVIRLQVEEKAVVELPVLRRIFGREVEKTA
jgi:hypothetical protein